MHARTPDEVLAIIRSLPLDVRRAVLIRANEQLDEDTPKPAAVRQPTTPARPLADWERFVASLPDAPPLAPDTFDRGSLHER